MRIARSPVAGIGTALLCLAAWSITAAQAETHIFTGSEAVEFESMPFTFEPSAFKIKQAQKLGRPVEITTEPAVKVKGYLLRPDTDDSRPAVVVMHTCAGISEHEESWARRLTEWGYVTFSVDSLGPRGYEYICDGRAEGGALTTPFRRALDAYGAKAYLGSLDYVDADRIAVIGMSHGGMTVLQIIRQSITDGLEMTPFQAAVAFYPLCGEAGPINAPTMILVGGADSWTPAVLCETLVQQMPPDADVELRVYPEAHHTFDHPGIDTIDMGHVIRTDPQASADAAAAVRRFLEEHL